MKQPVKHDVKRSTVFVGTTAIQPEDGGDTRRFFEHTGDVPDTDPASAAPAESAGDKLARILSDIPTPLRCPTCGEIWVVSGRPCDHEESALYVDPHALLLEFRNGK